MSEFKGVIAPSGSTPMTVYGAPFSSRPAPEHWDWRRTYFATSCSSIWLRLARGGGPLIGEVAPQGGLNAQHIEIVG